VDYLARVDPATRQVTARIPIGENPIDVSVGEGSVWVLDDDGSVHRIDPVANKSTLIEGVAKDPRGIAAGAGAVWVADGLENVVMKIDPASNRVVDTLAVDAIARAVVVGEGAVWVATGDHVARIDVSSGDVSEAGGSVFPFGAPPVTIKSRFAIAAGGGFVWETFSDYPKLARYEIATSDFRRIDLSFLPRDVTAAGNDVWIAACGTPGTVIRLDAGGEISATIPAGGAVCPGATSNGEPIVLAFGDDGLWVTDAVNGSISRIDELTNQVDPPIRVGDKPTAIAVGLGSVWVAVDGEVSSSPSTS
jgi:DNA-binding beta-propeller fold protein YncE